MSKQMSTLSVGQTYLVTFKQDQSVMQMRGTYLGWSRFYTRHEFDLRPEAGTTGVEPEQLISVTRDDNPHFIPEVVS